MDNLKLTKRTKYIKFSYYNHFYLEEDWNYTEVMEDEEEFKKYLMLKLLDKFSKKIWKRIFRIHIFGNCKYKKDHLIGIIDYRKKTKSYTCNARGIITIKKP